MEWASLIHVMLAEDVLCAGHGDAAENKADTVPVLQNKRTVQLQGACFEAR